MEFIFQVLAQWFSPIDEEQAKAQMQATNEVKEVEKETVLTEQVEADEQPNLFSMMEFH